jgi:hypothetical protein
MIGSVMRVPGQGPPGSPLHVLAPQAFVFNSSVALALFPSTSVQSCSNVNDAERLSGCCANRFARNEASTNTPLL